MKNYFTYLCICFFAIFGFLYMNRVIELSKSNDIILKQINDYKSTNDYKCNEGYINEYGIVLGINGKTINTMKSYTNMKGNGFKEELIEYDVDSCVTSASNNMDRYILGCNPSKNSISIVIDIDSGKYYEQMVSIFSNNNLDVGLLINNSFLEDNLLNLNYYDNFLFKGSNDKDFKLLYENIKKINASSIYCVKTNDYDTLEICDKYNLSSILLTNEINKNLLYNIKKSLNKGDIVFIKENMFNLNELSPTIKYIKSRGINIISMSELSS